MFFFILGIVHQNTVLVHYFHDIEILYGLGYYNLFDSIIKFFALIIAELNE